MNVQLYCFSVTRVHRNYVTDDR